MQQQRASGINALTRLWRRAHRNISIYVRLHATNKCCKDYLHIWLLLLESADVYTSESVLITLLFTPIKMYSQFEMLINILIALELIYKRFESKYFGHK